MSSLNAAVSKLSPQQQAVLNFAVNETGNLQIIARAGCGKTFTLLELCKLLNEVNPGYFKVFIGAFNKAIQLEIDAKLKRSGLTFPRFKASTMHSAGWTAWKAVYRNCKINNGKMFGIISDTLKTMHVNDAAKYRDYFSFLMDLISKAKAAGVGVVCPVNDTAAWWKIIDHYGLDQAISDDEGTPIEELVEFAIVLYIKSLNLDKEMVDFDDMLLAPLYHKIKVEQYDWVMIDEAQDTNVCRRLLAFKMMKPNGRMVFVGDPCQAIFGFTGADSRAMENICEFLGAKTLPLTVTYRCGKNIVKMAQEFVSDIEAAETNHDGVIRSVMLEDPQAPNYFWNEKFTKDDVIICRNNKPIVQLAYQMLRKGIPCRIEGRDIAKGLVRIITQWKRLTTLTAMMKKLDDWSEKQIQNLQAKGKEVQAGELLDKIETIKVLADAARDKGITTVDNFKEYIMSMFGDTEDGKMPEVLTLCTAHKSKGREWKRVFCLGRAAYMPSRWARKQWQLEQEQNLIYVAITRAIEEFIDVVVP